MVDTVAGPEGEGGEEESQLHKAWKKLQAAQAEQRKAMEVAQTMRESLHTAEQLLLRSTTALEIARAEHNLEEMKEAATTRQTSWS